jgi:uncharacterized repeat protein (TIGR01451 family)
MEQRMPRIAAMMALIACMLAALSMNVFAAGTTAGTSIANQATVSYNAGTNARTAQSGVVTLYVAHKVNGNFTPATAASSGPDNTSYTIPFTFTNSGNRADAFAITTLAKAGYTVTVLDATNNPIVTTGNINPDVTVNLQLKIVVAAGRPDGDTTQATVILKSTAVNAGNVVVANPSAQFVYMNTFTVKKPVVTFSAAQSAVTANASRIPGANVTYTMTLQNGGTGDITGISTITSVLSPNVVFVSAPAGTGYSAGVVTGQTAGRGGTVTWTVPAASLAHGAAAVSPLLTVQVDKTQNNGTGVVAGTQIYAMTTAQATQTKIAYNDGTNTIDLDNANSFNFAAGSASGASWTATPANNSGNPGDVVEYAFTLTNTGNHLDNYTFTNVQNGGNYDVNHVFATTSLGTGITTLPAAIAGGATQVVYVRVTVPLAATDAQTVARNILATTTTGTPDAPTGGTIAASYVAPLVTTVKAPVLAVTLTNAKISGIGTVTNPAPGDVVQWLVKITNTGTGSASAISSSNAGYAHTVTNIVNATSIDIDPLGANTWPTTGLGNGGTFTGTPNGTVTIAAGIVTVTFSQIAAGQSAQYRYTVTVQ